MKIAQIAPLWERVPPKTYGGTELVVYILCEEFAKQGHDVTLFASSDSITSARLEPVIETPMRESGVKININYELQAVAKVLGKCSEFDLIHNHIGYQFLPFVDLVGIPVLTTLHGAFVSDEEVEFYRSYKNLPFISISHSQRKGAPFLNYISTVYNGIEVEKYIFAEKPITDKPYLLFLGRLSEEKGAHLAIKLAKETGWNLIMAGKVDKHDIDYYEKEVKPLIDGKQITFIGEVAHDAKVELLKGAYATIHPVTWPEPFGLVMVESMACGTPVLALNKGSIPEVIRDKVTGFVENDIDALIKRVNDIEKIDRKMCRRHVETNFSAQNMSKGYLKAYESLINLKNIRDMENLQASAKFK